MKRRNHWKYYKLCYWNLVVTKCQKCKNEDKNIRLIEIAEKIVAGFTFSVSFRHGCSTVSFRYFPESEREIVASDHDLNWTVTKKNRWNYMLLSYSGWWNFYGHKMPQKYKNEDNVTLSLTQPESQYYTLPRRLFCVIDQGVTCWIEIDHRKHSR